MIRAKVTKIMTGVTAGIASVGSVLGAYTPNYTPADMPNIATDLIGSAGVEFKVYMPLFVLAFVITFAIARYQLVRRAYG